MIFIVNPISGSGRKNSIIAHLENNGHKVLCTEYPGHGEILARETDAEVVVAVGGDGTVNEVARGIINSSKTLGIIPCGSGDGLALHLGISRNYRRALKNIMDGKTIMIDAATINLSCLFQRIRNRIKITFHHPRSKWNNKRDI